MDEVAHDTPVTDTGGKARASMDDGPVLNRTTSSHGDLAIVTLEGPHRAIPWRLVRGSRLRSQWRQGGRKPRRQRRGPGYRVRRAPWATTLPLLLQRPGTGRLASCRTETRTDESARSQVGPEMAGRSRQQHRSSSAASGQSGVSRSYERYSDHEHCAGRQRRSKASHAGDWTCSRHGGCGCGRPLRDIGLRSMTRTVERSTMIVGGVLLGVGFIVQLLALHGTA